MAEDEWDGEPVYVAKVGDAISPMRSIATSMASLLIQYVVITLAVATGVMAAWFVQGRVLMSLLP